jgi:exopolyphosphatase/guanosine-5'-triphosphate,3'-diphosphate pyrophosphatase
MAWRWEWRTFGEQFGGAEERLGPIAPESVVESDETYLLAAESVDAVKLRDGLMDVKHLEQVDDDGLELWKPVMKASLPTSAADARAVLAALRVSAPLDRDTYDLADLAAAAGGAISVVPVHKLRRHCAIGGCMAELTDLRAGDRSTRTIAIESEEPARVIAAVRELGLGSRPNVNVPRGLRALVGASSQGS